MSEHNVVDVVDADVDVDVVDVRSVVEHPLLFKNRPTWVFPSRRSSCLHLSTSLVSFPS